MSTNYGLQTPLCSDAILGRMRKYGYSARSSDGRHGWVLGDRESHLFVFGCRDPHEPHMVSEVKRTFSSNALPIIRLLAWEFQIVIVDENFQFVRWPSPNFILERLAKGATDFQQLQGALSEVAKRPMLGSCIVNDSDDESELPYEVTLVRMLYDMRAVVRSGQWLEWRRMCFDSSLSRTSELVCMKPVAVDYNAPSSIWRDQDADSDETIAILPNLDGLLVR